MRTPCRTDRGLVGAALAAAQVWALCVALMFVVAANDATAQPASGDPDLVERILTGSSVDEVAITATFSGKEIFVYGAIARSRFLESEDPTPDVIITVRGPSSPLTVRKKARVGGVWMNTEAIRIASAPSYYAVASTRALADTLRPDEDQAFRISADKAVLILGLPTSAADPEAFRQAVVRLRREAGLYREAPGGVSLRAGTLFQTRLRLPANIVEGVYQITVYLLRDGLVRDQAQIALPVRKQGIERALGAAAQETPLLYGLGALLTALFAGWGANELFRRLRR